LAERATPEAVDQLVRLASSLEERLALPALFALAWSVSPASKSALTRLSELGPRSAIALQCLSTHRAAAKVRTQSTVIDDRAGAVSATWRIAICGFTSCGKSAAGRALQEKGFSVVELRRLGAGDANELDVADGWKVLVAPLTEAQSDFMIVGSPFGHRAGVTTALARAKVRKVVLETATEVVVERMALRPEFRPYFDLSASLRLDFGLYVHAVRACRHAGYRANAAGVLTWDGGTPADAAELLANLGGTSVDAV
jgi:hypothetical protein